MDCNRGHSHACYNVIDRLIFNSNYLFHVGSMRACSLKNFLKIYALKWSVEAICDWICEKAPFSHTKFDPFFELYNFITF